MCPVGPLCQVVREEREGTRTYRLVSSDPAWLHIPAQECLAGQLH